MDFRFDAAAASREEDIAEVREEHRDCFSYTSFRDKVLTLFKAHKDKVVAADAFIVKHCYLKKH
jgi:hypothetical protein